MLVPEEERDAVAESGTELKGITLPSLRRLFEIAVGASDAASLPLPRHSPTEQSPDAQNIPEVKPRAESSHLTRTLGHHADTPALAPFLGRAPQKRLIHVHEEGEPVDIFGTPHSAPSPRSKQGWRMPYSHRNAAREELDEEIALPSVVNNPEPSSVHARVSGHDSSDLGQTVGGQQSGSAPSGSLSASRFHIAVRISISDHSLWLSPGTITISTVILTVITYFIQNDVPSMRKTKLIDGVFLFLLHLT